MIAIISDSHDNLANLKKVASFVKEKRIDTIIHCGDVASVQVMRQAFGKFNGNIYIAMGNLDKERDFPAEVPYPNWKIHQEFGSLRNIAFTHFPEKARELAESGKYGIVFYGHTHKPWEEKVKGTRMINPGNVAGLFYRASFATYEKGRLKLVIL